MQYHYNKEVNMDTKNVQVDEEKGEYFIYVGNSKVQFVPLSSNKKYPPLKPKK